MTSPDRDDLLDDMIDALISGPKTHNQLARILAPKHRVTGSDVNSWLYSYEGRFFIADRPPAQGLPTWRLSEPVLRKRRKRQCESASPAAEVRAPREMAARPREQASPMAGARADFDRKAFRRRRKQLGLTQKQMAARLDVPAGSISPWECGSAIPNELQRAAIEALMRTIPRGVALAPGNAAGVHPAITFGDWMVERRRVLGISQADLAVRAYVSLVSISHIETGRTSNPRPDTRRRIEAVLRVR
jgi:transcriptional regulator with XRE-family HTH domain